MGDITKDDIRLWLKEAVEEYFHAPKPKDRLTIDEAIDFLAGCGYVTTKSKLHKLSASESIPRDIINGKISFLRTELQIWADQQIAKDTSLSNAALLLARSARRKGNRGVR